MSRKPWSILILTIVQFLTPLFNIALGVWIYKTSVWAFITTIVHHSNWHGLIEFFASGPISGVAIYLVRWWSYPIFLACIVESAFSNFIEWRQHPALVGLPTLLSCYLLNVILVSYFFIPSVRKVYFNPRVRWWESKPRYSLLLNSRFSVKGKDKKCVLINLSEGGALIETETQLEPDTQIKLTFSNLNQEFHVNGEVVYNISAPADAKGRTKNNHLHGVRFVFTPASKQKIKNCVKAFELLGLPRKPERENSWVSFINWTKTPYIFYKHKKNVHPSSMITKQESSTLNAG